MTSNALSRGRCAARSLGGLLLVATAAAQTTYPTLGDLHPVGTGTQAEIDFVLGGPTDVPQGTHVMLVCYVSIIDDPGNEWSDLILRAIQAVSAVQVTQDASGSFTTGIAGVDAAADLGVYTVPRSIISEAVLAVDWGTNAIGGWAREFVVEGGTMLWPATGWPSGGSTMNWSSLGAGDAVFDVDALLAACLARQIGYAMDLAPTHLEVCARVTAVMDKIHDQSVGCELNAVAVELLTPPNGPTKPTIKLSRTKKVTIQLAASGGESDYFHWDFVYPALAGGPVLIDSGLALNLAAPAASYEIVVPTSTGFAQRPLAVVPAYETWGFSCTELPADIITGQFAIWDATHGQFVAMAGLGGPTTLNWLYVVPPL
ncbi:MAG: hypothetical protein KDE27_25025 [Planctomycetes bacterium]|nr:hypothetical protein [Planctomycetota bacterium]